MKRFSLKLIILALLAGTNTCYSSTGADDILNFSKKLMYTDRSDLSCDGDFSFSDFTQYYSVDFMKRVNVICSKKGKTEYRFVMPDNFLDGESAAGCHGREDRSSPCFAHYDFGKPAIQGDRAIIKVTYRGGDSDPSGSGDTGYYTVLKLIRENGRWLLDDVALIDSSNSGTRGYDESRYSIKADLDEEIRGAEAKKNQPPNP